MDYSAPTNFGQNITTGIVIGINEWLVAFFWLAIIFILLLIIKKIIKKLVDNSKYFEQAIYLVRLPKEKPEGQESEFDVKHLQEEIAKGETVFSSIGGLKAERGFKAWLLGRSDHYSFEVVANKGNISFYVAAPRYMGRYMEQQILAHYSDAVMEEVEDYNIFNPQNEILAGALKVKRDFIFPLKTYKKMDADPMNAIINVMSKLSREEGLAVQYTVRSAKGIWHKKSSKIVSKAHRCQSVAEAINNKGLYRILNWLRDITRSAKPKTKLGEAVEEKKKLSAMEEDLLRGIEEKNSKAGLDVNLRIVVSAKDKGRARIYLDNLTNAFSQYNYYEYGNSFKNKIYSRGQKRMINNFIYRRFDEKVSNLFNTEEMASMFHFPLRNADTPNILWLTAKHAPAPNNIPNEGILLGQNIYRGITSDIRIKRLDRRRHTYIIGKSGVGKSQLMASMAIQDILNGEGVCLIDPHGDMITEVLARIPPARAEDVILFSPADTSRPMALNLMEYDPRYPEQKTFVINEMIKIFDKLYDLKATGGPIFEQYMRNAMLLVMSDPSSGSTLMEIPKVLSDAEFRKLKLERCQDPTVVDFWKKEAEKAGGDAALANVVPYVTSKLTSFISNDMMRSIIGQQKSSINLRDIMDNKKILLIDIPKGLVGEMNTYLLGMILVGKILMAALSRADIPQADRCDFYLYIDEFQNFTTDSINSILSEARKYNLSLILAHQYLGQLTMNKNDNSIKEAVFGNIGTWILFKIGSEDAEVMEKEFSPVFNKFDLINIEKFTAYVKLLIENTAARPFSMKTIWPLPGSKRDDMPARIRSLSSLKYGQERSMVEAEIRRRTKI